MKIGCTIEVRSLTLSESPAGAGDPPAPARVSFEANVLLPIAHYGNFTNDTGCSTLSLMSGSVERQKTMPKRCGDPECGNLVNEKKVHHRLGDTVFCSIDCANAWLVQNKVFEVASDPFHDPMIRRTPNRMNGG